MEGPLMYLLSVLIGIAVGIPLTIRWLARRSADVTEYYADSDDATMETLLRTNEMRGNHF